MKAFEKLKVSRTEFEGSTLVDTLYLAMKDHLTQEEIEEVIAMLADNLPSVNRGAHINSNDVIHLFNGSEGDAQKLLFILSGIQCNNQKLFRIGKSYSKFAVAYIGPVSLITTAASIKAEETIKEMVVEEKETSGSTKEITNTEKETNTEETGSGKETETENTGAGVDEMNDNTTEENKGSEVTGNTNKDETTSDMSLTEGLGKISKAKLIDFLAANSELSKNSLKKMETEQIIEKIVELVSAVKITEFVVGE